jgi:ABC-type Fe3+-hydroxamate transport system substrate-binding protein
MVEGRNVMMNLTELMRVPDLGTAPKRVVSLVPSITESLFQLGFGHTVVGVTDYCIHPGSELARLPRIGGPKNPNLARIAELSADLIFASQEENSMESVQGLLNSGFKVWLTFPKTVDETLDVLRNILAIYHTDMAARQIVTLQMAVDWARRAAESQQALRFFCPIWFDRTDGEQWWMTFNAETYGSDLLTTLGGENVFAHRKRLYPLEADLGIVEAEDTGTRDNRYPRVTLNEIVEAQPEVLFLPSEPFSFNVQHKLEYMDLMSGTPAVKYGRVYLVDGSLVTWPGVRLAKALNELPKFFEQ